jgi:hypothetical protein
MIDLTLHGLQLLLRKRRGHPYFLSVCKRIQPESATPELPERLSQASPRTNAAIQDLEIFGQQFPE